MSYTTHITPHITSAPESDLGLKVGGGGSKLDPGDLGAMRRPAEKFIGKKAFIARTWMIGATQPGKIGPPLKCVRGWQTSAVWRREDTYALYVCGPWIRELECRKARERRA